MQGKRPNWYEPDPPKDAGYFRRFIRSVDNFIDRIYPSGSSETSQGRKHPTRQGPFYRYHDQEPEQEAASIAIAREILVAKKKKDRRETLVLLIPLSMIVVVVVVLAYAIATAE